jgi:holo-[acyl-carrier protein] synthase
MLGNDIIEVERIGKAIRRYGQKFLDRLFTPGEQAYCLKHRDSDLRFAGRFAAKEAVAKALGTGFNASLSWLDIEIVNDSAGKPIAVLSERSRQTFGDPSLHVSISHCKLYATAVALCMTRQPSSDPVISCLY